MQALAETPGVVRKSTRIYVTQEDVTVLLGCGKSKAYDIVRDMNEQAKKKGKHPFPAGKANKYQFSDIFDIPIEEVDKVINKETGGIIFLATDNKNGVLSGIDDNRVCGGFIHTELEIKIVVHGSLLPTDILHHLAGR